MPDIASTKVRLAELENQKKSIEADIKYKRSLRSGYYKDDEYQKGVLSDEIDADKASIQKIEAQISGARALINQLQSQQQARQASEIKTLAMQKDAAARLKQINADQLVGQKSKPPLGGMSPDASAEPSAGAYGSVQQAANAASPVQQQSAQVQQQAAAMPAFTKFSGLGGQQMRGQVSAPPQNVIGQQQNAFNLPNAQGIKFGGK